MKEMLPLVSIIVPSLNRAHFLAPTLESILKQDYPHLECIVVDGGSRDGTLDMLRSYNGRIKWISEPDKGHADAVNKGWRMAKGKILTWLNADDCYAVPDAVRQVVEHFQENPNTDLIYGDYKVLSEQGKVISGVVRPREWDLEYAIKHCFYTITQPASFIRRSILEKVGFLDSEVCHNDDHELWLRIGLRGTVCYAPIFLAYTRRCQGLCHNQEAARAKVLTIEKILRNPVLPERFQTIAFKRRAMSNAYLTGALSGLVGRHWRIFFSYLIKAFRVDLSNLIQISARVIRAIVLFPFPERLKVRLRSYLNAFQHDGFRFNNFKLRRVPVSTINEWIGKVKFDTVLKFPTAYGECQSDAVQNRKKVLTPGDSV